MALAANVATVIVTGTYVDFQGSPIAGQVIFRVPKTLRNALADQILVPSSYYATLDANGQFTATLPATDDPDFNETFTYTVVESFSGGRTFSMTLPEPLTYAQFATQTYAYYVGQQYGYATGSAADIADLAPASTFTQYIGLAPYSAYGPLEARVTAAEASVDTTPPTTGVALTSQYGSLPVGYAAYSAIPSALATYALLTSSQIVASTAGVQALASQAQASASAAQASQATTEAFEVRDPHPFVFTGAA